MRKTEKISFRASQELKTQVFEAAKLQSVSSGQLIRSLIEEYLKNQVLKSSSHYYELQDGTQFSNMKELCDKLQISSLTARKRVKNGVIKKITTNTNQTQKYGEKIQTTRSSSTTANRFSIQA